jgi:hypothetical protein
MNEDVDYDPWDDAPDEIDPAEIREMLYESGIKSFPLDVLEKMWLRELRDVGLSKVEAPPAYPRRQRATRWTGRVLHSKATCVRCAWARAARVLGSYWTDRGLSVGTWT